MNQLLNYADVFDHASHRLLIAPFSDHLVSKSDRLRWSSASWSTVLAAFSKSKIVDVRSVAREWQAHHEQTFSSAGAETVWSSTDVHPVAKLAYLGSTVQQDLGAQEMLQSVGDSGYPLMQFFSPALPLHDDHHIRVELQNASRDKEKPSALQAKFCLRTLNEVPESFNLPVLREIGETILHGRLDWKTRGGTGKSSAKYEGHFKRNFSSRIFRANGVTGTSAMDIQNSADATSSRWMQVWRRFRKSPEPCSG